MTAAEYHWDGVFKVVAGSYLSGRVAALHLLVIDDLEDRLFTAGARVLEWFPAFGAAYMTVEIGGRSIRLPFTFTAEEARAGFERVCRRLRELDVDDLP